MKADLTLKQNIDALLRIRNKTRRDLAQHVLQTLDRRADSWISHIFGKKGYYTRVVPSQYLDRIAAFFGVEVYQLFQPGIAGSVSERRRDGSDRRLKERRIIGRRGDPTTPTRHLIVTPEDEDVLADYHALPHGDARHARAWLHVAALPYRRARSTGSETPLPDEPLEATPTVDERAARSGRGSTKRRRASRK